MYHYAKDCLVHIPQFPHTPFAGLIHYERMHVFFIAYCTYLMELLSNLVPKEKYHIISRQVRACHSFRDPVTGRTHPRLQSIVKLTHLTAERRVRSIFYWAHALGPKAEILPETVRTDAVAAVGLLQLLLIATRGHRSYTQLELDTIFLDAGKEFFRSLERLSEYAETSRLRRGRVAHERNPNNTRPPNPFKRQRRYTLFPNYSFIFPNLVISSQI